MMTSGRVAAQSSIAVCALFLLSACNGDPGQAQSAKSQHEVGTVSIATTLVAPFEDYADLLAPNFKLDADMALAKVIGRTGTFERRLLDRFGASATVSVQAVGAAAPTSTTDSSGDRKQTPSGRDGTSSGAPAADSKLDTIADPMLQYTAATALYQEIQLLRRAVSDAALGRNRRSYVVRLQMNVVPFARNLPYDVYTLISFFAEGSRPGQPPHLYERVEILPLLVTDSLEGALESQSLEWIRQYAVALGGAAPTVAGNVKLDKNRDEVQNWRGTALNSLLTVGRLNNNTIQVRLGAARQGDSHVMIPQNHNITFVVTVPAPFVENASNQGAEYTPAVRVVAKTVMRNATTGEALPHQTIDKRISNVEGLLKNHFQDNAVPPTANGFCPGPKDSGQCTAEQRQRNAADYLLRQVYANDYKKFDETLVAAGWDRTKLRFERDLWSEMVETLGQSEFSAVSFELPFDHPPKLPDTQPVLVVDNVAKDEMSVVMTGGSGLFAENLTAELIVQTKDGGSLRIPAQKISSAGGRDPII